MQAGGGVILQLMNKAKYLEHKESVVEEKRENNETPLANNYHCTGQKLFLPENSEIPIFAIFLVWKGNFFC